MEKHNIHIVVVVIILLFSLFLNRYSLEYSGNVVKDFSTREALEDLDKIKQTVNSNTEKFPNFVKTVFGNERINIILKMNDGSIVNLWMETENAKIINLAYGELDNPTLVVETSEDTLNRIGKSEKPIDEFLFAINNGEIRYEAKKITSGIKTGIGKFLSRIFYWIK